MRGAIVERKDRSAGRGERGGDARKEILDAAAEAFMKKGFAATSIDDIADTLGSTKGRVYHHFRSKVDLFFEVHKEAMAMDLVAVRASMENVGSPVAQLYAMATAHLLVMMREIAYQCVVMQGLEMHQAGQTTAAQRKTLQEILSSRDEYEQLFSNTIERAIEAGEIPKQDVRVVVKAFLGSLNWTTIWYRPRDNESEAERRMIAAGIAGFVVQGLGGRVPEDEAGPR